MSSFTQIDEGQEGEEQGNKKLKSCQCFICTKQKFFYGVYFLGIGGFFYRLSHINYVLQVKPKPLEVSSDHHDARRLSIDT